MEDRTALWKRFLAGLLAMAVVLGGPGGVAEAAREASAAARARVSPRLPAAASQSVPVAGAVCLGAAAFSPVPTGIEAQAPKPGLARDPMLPLTPAIARAQGDAVPVAPARTARPQSRALGTGETGPFATGLADLEEKARDISAAADEGETGTAKARADFLFDKAPAQDSQGSEGNEQDQGAAPGLLSARSKEVPAGSAAIPKPRAGQAGKANVGLLLAVAVTLGVIGLAFSLRAHWAPLAPRWIQQAVGYQAPAKIQEGRHGGHDHDEEERDGHDHKHHDHEHEGAAADGARGSASGELRLSPEARQTVGVMVGRAEARSFSSAITVPGVVSEIPGQTRREVSVPVGGEVAEVSVREGQAVAPGELLLVLSLNEDEQLKDQREYIQELTELDFQHGERRRLEPLVAQGVIARQTWLELENKIKKLEESLASRRGVLLQRGLTEEQLRLLRETRQLVTRLELRAPGANAAQGPVFVVSSLEARPGQRLAQAERVLTLSDYSALQIEGRAFESDMAAVQAAAQSGAALSAYGAQAGERSPLASGLTILILSNEVDRASRSYPFYVGLQNQISRDARADGRRYVTWLFKPGQRLELRVPVASWEGRVVLPSAAVAADGAESYVFVPAGGHFHGERYHYPSDGRFKRVAVRVLHRDEHWVVLGPGGVSEGSAVVLRGAQQMQMSLKLSGTQSDPHAGHNH